MRRTFQVGSPSAGTRLDLFLAGACSDLSRSRIQKLIAEGAVRVDGGEARTAVATTLVRFRPLYEALLGWYLATGEWRERAGAYAIQGHGAALVAAIDGDYSNVVGLPVPTLLDLAPGLLLGEPR